MYKNLYNKNKQDTDRSSRRLILDIYDMLADLTARVATLEGKVNAIMSDLQSCTEPEHVHEVSDPGEVEPDMEEKSLIAKKINTEETPIERWDDAYKKRLESAKVATNNLEQMAANANEIKKLDYIDSDEYKYVNNNANSTNKSKGKKKQSGGK